MDPSVVDLGPCRALEHRGATSDDRVVLLPGARYTTQAPLLWFARAVALARGLGVLAVVDELPDTEDPFSWARYRASRALDFEPPARQAVVGKSLASAAARDVADRGVSAIWLTPLLDQEAVVDGLARARPPTMLIGGTDDSTWRPERLRPGSSLEIVQLDGLDHSLEAPGDVQRSLSPLDSRDAISRRRAPVTIMQLTVRATSPGPRGRGRSCGGAPRGRA